jgi:hypothetical protein
MLVAGDIDRDPSHDSSIASLMATGEELTYEVGWTFVKLGKIRVKMIRTTKSDMPFSVVALTDSYDLPFVDFHAVSTSEMDSSLFSKGATLYENKDGKGLKQIYHFDPATKRYITEHQRVSSPRAQPSAVPTFDTLWLSHNRIQDGTSILYYARSRIHDQRAVRVPTLVRGKAGYTNFYFPSELSTVDIDAVGYPVRVLEFEGLAEFEGIFGLTGEFTGWFSDDEAAVPIKAKMKVIVGSITIELKEWKRPGWTPPRVD